ncbi:PQQ-dependent sugar dehydrogenase [Thermanaerothrix sp. 4228-RoL]|uniref:PQQ-dependent sugar dehydrogenase n=1 Tax=Thermanaerothrix solaris TaxID=3058434 RepID=A0ABU3NML4_9CHLR|nr:PQQ-dependent sugar dehydrogenase [Thermanaerothrix sp. 4228-RoL]MDT8898074.1 PQQ-dependent sugar dehydrogenase [Thermanaerothrix sp. 4228-RoL]
MWRWWIIVIIVCIGWTIVGHTAAAQSGGGMTLYLPLVSKAPPLPPADEAGRRLQVAPGFAIRIFAENLPQRPRFMAFGPDGWLYVSLMNSGQIARLPDRNSDGRADTIEIVASDLNLPHGLEWRDGWLYVAEGDRIERLRDGDGNGSLETRELITDNIPAPVGHSSRTLHFGPDGKLYVSAGSSCNYCVEDDPRRAAILRFNPDGSIPGDNPFATDLDPRRRPVWAWGLRNSVDFLWTPGGELWADHNGSDGLGDDLPPEEIVIPVQGGAWHGWPYCYTPGVGVVSGPEVQDTRIALPAGQTCDQAVPARFTAPAHSAPLGMTLGEGTLFPPAYRQSLYVAYHGSWNTTAGNIRDCKVERILLNEVGQPIAAEPFVTGFRAPGKPCGDAATYGRPADVIFGPEGAMYISDDKGLRIYRVVPVP